MKKKTAAPAPPKVGKTIQRLRQAYNLSLGELADKSGVSKSIISQIERNEANPTIGTIWRLSNALDIKMEDVIGTEETTAFFGTLTDNSTPVIRSEDGLCTLRVVSPLQTVEWVQWYEFTARPGGVLESDGHQPGSTEHLTLLEGTLKVTALNEKKIVSAGETIRYRCHLNHVLHNTVAESAILSLNNAYIEKLLQQKKKNARILKKMKDNIDRTLSSILIMNNTVNTVGAIIIGAKSAEVFGEKELFFVSFAVTLVLLIFAEIVPKSIGAYHWKSVSLLLSYYLRFIVFITYPLLHITEMVTRFVKPAQNISLINREDIMLMINIARKEGQIADKDEKFIRNYLAIEQTEINEIMTPRTVMFTEDMTITAAEFYRRHPDCNFSRIPVYSGDEDNIEGMVIKNEILRAILDGKGDMPLSGFKRNVRSVPETMTVSELFGLLLNKKIHMVLAVNEYGTIDGLVTLEDIIEFIIGGEIIDESDKVTDLRNLAVQRWKTRMMLHTQKRELMPDRD
ncbi:hypothetical protein CHS0354_018354 [Potamilus streckersoni]|uniref:Uncharacterized protein n=1 Tax=Potamilus streckersoni TaxID=2493646 RepID=A0AAE0TBE8_9BIVA|nr:hypothetical protein CHS0354_018354 [Potamilus streckersoni]